MTHRQPPVSFDVEGQDRRRPLGRHQLRARRRRRRGVQVLPDRLLPAASRRGVRGPHLSRPLARRAGRGNAATGDRAAAYSSAASTGRCLPPSTSSSCRWPSGIELKLLFEGDLFEMEDQRNWTDASFKTYCTPQSARLSVRRPWPVERFSQKVTIRGHRSTDRRAAATPSPHDAVAPSRRPRHRGSGGRCRRSASRCHASGEPHSDAEIALLAPRIPVTSGSSSRSARAWWGDRLAGAATTAGALGCPLEVAAFAESDGQLDQLVTERLATLPARAARCSPAARDVDPAMTGSRARASPEHGLRVPVIGGTDLLVRRAEPRPSRHQRDGRARVRDHPTGPHVRRGVDRAVARGAAGDGEDGDRRSRPACRFWSARSHCGRAIRSSSSHLTRRNRFAAVLGRSRANRRCSLRRGRSAASRRSRRRVPRASPTTRPWAAAGSSPATGRCHRASCSSARSPGGAFAVFHVFADVLEFGLDGRRPALRAAVRRSLRSGAALRRSSARPDRQPDAGAA